MTFQPTLHELAAYHTRIAKCPQHVSTHSVEHREPNGLGGYGIARYAVCMNCGGLFPMPLMLAASPTDAEREE